MWAAWTGMEAQGAPSASWRTRRYWAAVDDDKGKSDDDNGKSTTDLGGGVGERSPYMVQQEEEVLDVEEEEEAHLGACERCTWGGGGSESDFGAGRDGGS